MSQRHACRLDTTRQRRFAMIDDGIGFQLVPWHPVLKAHRQHITGIMRSAGGIEWG
jgi:hypothetical protein